MMADGRGRWALIVEAVQDNSRPACRSLIISHLTSPHLTSHCLTGQTSLYYLILAPSLLSPGESLCILAASTDGLAPSRTQHPMPNGLCDTRIQTTCCCSCPLRWAVGRVDNYSHAAVSSIQTRNRFLFSGAGRPCLHLGRFDSTAAAGCLAVRARAHHGNSRPERLSPQSFSNGYLAAHAADGTLKLKLANGPDTVSARTTCLTEFRAPPMGEKLYTAITMHARRTSTSSGLAASSCPVLAVANPL